MTGSRPLVSFVIIGRNDGYMGDYLYRLSTSVSFLAQSAGAAGLLDDLEVLIVDWASERPLADVLPLTAAARRITAFLEVSPETVQALWGREQWRPSTAVNAGVRRARGEFVFFTDSDCLWSTAAVSALGRLLRDEHALPLPVAELFGYVRRYQVPWATVSRKPHLDEWTRLGALLSAGLRAEEPSAACLGGFSAGQLMHRDLWHAARGYDEALERGWGWADNDLMLRVSQHHPWLDLSGYGFFGLHMEHWPTSARAPRDPAVVNPMIIHDEPSPNGPDWGLGSCDLPATASRCEAIPIGGAGCAVPLSGRTASPQWQAEAAAADFVQAIGADRESPAVPLHDLAAVADVALADRPRSVYWFGPIRPAVLLTMLRASPGAELWLINPWPPGASDDRPFHPGQLAEFLGARGRFRGWARIVQGESASSLDRIERSRIGDTPVEFAWIDPGTDPALIRQLAGWLAPGGVMLCPAEEESDRVARLATAAAGCVTRLLPGTQLFAVTRARDTNSHGDTYAQ